MNRRNSSSDIALPTATLVAAVLVATVFAPTSASARGGRATTRIETTLNIGAQSRGEGAGKIGSQTAGAGAGKVTFNPFSVTR